MFLLASLAELGVAVNAAADMGELSGAVIGNVRLSYDVFGATVETAEQLAAVATSARTQADTEECAGLCVAVSRRALLMAHLQQHAGHVPDHRAARDPSSTSVMLARTPLGDGTVPAFSVADGTRGPSAHTTPLSLVPSAQRAGVITTSGNSNATSGGSGRPGGGSTPGAAETASSAPSEAPPSEAKPVTIVVSTDTITADVRGRPRVDANRVLGVTF
jgi:hypothetical protein